MKTKHRIRARYGLTMLLVWGGFCLSAEMGYAVMTCHSVGDNADDSALACPGETEIGYIGYECDCDEGDPVRHLSGGQDVTVIAPGRACQTWTASCSENCTRDTTACFVVDTDCSCITGAGSDDGTCLPCIFGCPYSGLMDAPDICAIKCDHAGSPNPVGLHPPCGTEPPSCYQEGQAGACGSTNQTGNRVTAGWQIGERFNEETGCFQPAVLGGGTWCCGLGECTEAYGWWGVGWQFLPKDCRGDVVVRRAGWWSPSEYTEVHLEFFGRDRPNCDDDGCCDIPNPCPTCNNPSDPNGISPLASTSSNVGGSLEYQLFLGSTAYGQKGASLVVYAKKPYDGLARAKNLRVRRESLVTVTPYPSGIIHYVDTAQGRVTITTDNNHKYNMVVTDSGQTELKTVTVENPDGGAGPDINKLYITEKTGGNTVAVRLFEWDDTNQSWTLKEGLDADPGNIKRTTTKQELVSEDGLTYTDTTTVKNGNSGAVVSCVEQTRRIYPWGELKLCQEVMDPGLNHANLTSTWEYYESQTQDGSNYGWMKKHTTPTGYWEYFSYSHPGGGGPDYAKTTVSQLGSNQDPGAFNSNDTTNVVTTMYTYIDRNVVTGKKAKMVRKTIVKAANVLKETRYYVRWEHAVPTEVSGFHDKWEIVCNAPDDGSSWDGENGVAAFLSGLLNNAAPADLVTRTRVYDPGNTALAYKPLWVVEPTGMCTLYTYSAASGGTQVTTRNYGIPDDRLSPSSVLEGEKTITVVNEQGGECSTEVQHLARGAQPVTTSVRTVQSWDGLGRPTQIQVSAGDTYTITQSYGCCGLEDVTERGRHTHYDRDVLGRITATTTPDGVTTSQTYDASNRVLTRTRAAGGTSIDTDQNTYDTTGRLTKHKDQYDQYTFYTYRQIDPANSGNILNEVRIYPDNKDAGPVQVTWSNGQGTVRRWAGTSTNGWSNSTTLPTGTEELAEVSREEMDLDHAGRVHTAHRYFALAGLGLTGLGTKNTNYYETQNDYNHLGQLFLQTDEMGNITQTLYASGRVTEQCQGIDTDGLKSISKTLYTDGFNHDVHDYATRVSRLRPVDTVTGEDGDFAYTDFEHAYYSDHREVRTKPAGDNQTGASPAPWVTESYDYQGRQTERIVYLNGSTTTVLAHTKYLYDPTTGYLTTIQQYAGAGTSHLDTTYAYDSLGRQVIVGRPGGGFTHAKYDAYGRVAWTVQAASVGADPNSFENDLVVSETDYTYDSRVASNRVILVTTYERLYDTPADALGLLSAGANAGRSRVTCKCFWYDDQGRVTHEADYGTNVQATRPTSPRDVTGLVTDYVYGVDGKYREATDNAGHVTRTEYDALGRTTRLIENYHNAIPGDTTGDDDRITTYTYNAVGIVTQTAHLAGSTQTTTYGYGGTDSPVPTYSQLVSIQYPQGSTGSGLVQMAYYADGSLHTRIDQRNVELTFVYDNTGHRLSQEVTGGTVPDGTDRKVSYGYTGLGQPYTITTKDASNTITSSIQYDYNGYGQIETETLDLDGDGPFDPKTIGYTYSGGSASRLTSLAYPSARAINYVYNAHSNNNSWSSQQAIGDAFSRITQIKDGTSGPVLAEYTFTGMSQLVGRAELTNRVVQRIMTSSGGTGYDAFGRVESLQHVTYGASLNFTQASPANVCGGATYGYNDASLRTFDNPLLMPAHGQAYQYDGLNRLIQADRGVLDASHQVSTPYASPRTIEPTYDLLGNFLEDGLNGHVETRLHNSANEIVSRSVTTTAVDPGKAMYLVETFDNLDHWTQDPLECFEPVGNQAIAGVQATDDDGLPWGGLDKAQMMVDSLDHLTDIHLKVDVRLPQTGAYAGIVFGYRSADDYWVYLVKAGTAGAGYIYRVVEGVWEQKAVSSTTSVPVGTFVTLNLAVQGHCACSYGLATVSFTSNDIAPGTVGLVAGVDDVRFSGPTIRRIDWPAPALPTWQAYDGAVAVDTSEETMSLSVRDGHPLAVAMREGFWADDCAIWATLTTDWQGGIAFRIQDKNNYFVVAPFMDWVFVWRVRDGQWGPVAADYLAENMDWSEPHDWCVRVTCTSLDLSVMVDGTSITVFDSTGNGADVLDGGPGAGAVGLGTTGMGADPVVCTAFGYGYMPEGENFQLIGYDLFDASCLTVQPVYDAAGNLTDDGIYYYGYDAWNRLISVDRKAFWADEDYAAVARYGYDGLGHRVYKLVMNSGDASNGGRNREEFYYYNQKWQLLEIDNASNHVRQQFVWGTRHIDEAICMDVDTDTVGSGYGNCTDEGSRHFFYMQDANWNVVGLREGTNVVERYEYDPYGTVRIYEGYSAEDGHELQTVTSNSLKWLDADLPGNPVLYAGHLYDSESELNQVRLRMYRNRLARWIQRDPVEYADAMSLYQYAHGDPIRKVDSSGTLTVEPGDGNLDQASCTEPVYKSWTYDVSQSKHPAGYIVQEVTVTCAASECRHRRLCECGECKRPAPVTYSYLEAWFVSESDDETEQNDSVGDSFVAPVRDDTCGLYNQVTTIKFYPITVTGDLGRLDRPNPLSGWSTTKTYGPSGCTTSSKGAPSTNDPPWWWADPWVDPLGGEGPAGRYAHAWWNCCCLKFVAASATQWQ